MHQSKAAQNKKTDSWPLSPVLPANAAASVPLGIAAASVAPWADAFVAALSASAGPSAFGVASSLLLAADKLGCCGYLPWRRLEPGHPPQGPGQKQEHEEQ